MVPYAPVVKWISQQSSELLLGVRVLPGALNRSCFLIIYGHVAEFGIRVRLRSVWSNPWEFKSPRAHLIILRKSTCKQLILLAPSAGTHTNKGIYCFSKRLIFVQGTIIFS